MKITGFVGLGGGGPRKDGYLCFCKGLAGYGIQNMALNMALWGVLCEERCRKRQGEQSECQAPIPVKGYFHGAKLPTKKRRKYPNREYFRPCFKRAGPRGVLRLWDYFFI
jgi:hypothetical protein